ncbi:MAG: hypothetical protein R2706_16275 [Acidimicrobiales bacterium]
MFEAPPMEQNADAVDLARRFAKAPCWSSNPHEQTVQESPSRSNSSVALALRLSAPSLRVRELETAAIRRAGAYNPEAQAELPYWPYYLMIAAYPLWWVLGLSGFMWAILAVPMLASLTRRRGLVVPKGILIWILFLVAVTGSVTSMDGGIGRCRAGCFATATTSEPRSSSSICSTAAEASTCGVLCGR